MEFKDKKRSESSKSKYCQMDQFIYIFPPANSLFFIEIYIRMNIKLFFFKGLGRYCLYMENLSTYQMKKDENKKIWRNKHNWFESTW